MVFRRRRRLAASAGEFHAEVTGAVATPPVIDAHPNPSPTSRSAGVTVGAGPPATPKCRRPWHDQQANDHKRRKGHAITGGKVESLNSTSFVAPFVRHCRTVTSTGPANA